MLDRDYIHVAVYVEPENVKRLRNLAQRDDRSVSSFVRRLILERLEREERMGN